LVVPAEGDEQTGGLPSVTRTKVFDVYYAVDVPIPRPVTFDNVHLLHFALIRSDSI
jgi:hypothetical protein